MANSLRSKLIIAGLSLAAVPLASACSGHKTAEDTPQAVEAEPTVEVKPAQPFDDVLQWQTVDSDSTDAVRNVEQARVGGDTAERQVVEFTCRPFIVKVEDGPAAYDDADNFVCSTGTAESAVANEPRPENEAVPASSWSEYLVQRNGDGTSSVALILSDLNVDPLQTEGGAPK